MKREILQEDKKNKPKHFPYGYDMTYTHTHTHISDQNIQNQIFVVLCVHM